MVYQIGKPIVGATLAVLLMLATFSPWNVGYAADCNCDPQRLSCGSGKTCKIGGCSNPTSEKWGRCVSTSAGGGRTEPPSDSFAVPSSVEPTSRTPRSGVRVQERGKESGARKKLAD